MPGGLAALQHARRRPGAVSGHATQFKQLVDATVEGAERFNDEVAPKLAELLLEIPGVKQFMDRIKAFTSIFGGGGGELWEAMVEELCDLGPGVLGRLPDGAEDVIDALCTFQAEGMDGLSDIVEAKLRELSGEVTDIASSAVATASSHLDNVLAPLYDAQTASSS